MRHTLGVAAVRWTSTLERVLIEDVRADGTFLRVTLHADAAVLVFSHWKGDVCLAATRVPVDAARSLITLLEDAAATSDL